jgi:hypothetical protein
LGAQAAGAEAARAGTIEGARAQAEQERLAREFQEEQFQKAIERQQPFLEAGQEASPLLTMAIRNELESSRMPAADIRKAQLAAGLEGAPEFVTERAGRGIEAIEAENQKARLLELVQTGLGAAGAVSGERAQLGSLQALSGARIGNIGAGALQQAAAQRQGTVNQAVSAFGGLPAFIAAQRRRGTGQPLGGPTFTTTASGRQAFVA